MEINYSFLINTTKKFKEAPSNFYSPVGRIPFLTQKEIETRSLIVNADLDIIKKEIVFRKIWEISFVKKGDQELAISYLITFLKSNYITYDAIVTIAKELLSEIEQLKKGKGRIIHNPY